jgi:hypothetical protein
MPPLTTPRRWAEGVAGQKAVDLLGDGQGGRIASGIGLGGDACIARA